MWWEPALVPLAGHEQRTPVVFRIRIGRVTGRRAAPMIVKTVDVSGNASEARRPHWLARFYAVCGVKTAPVSPDA